ncbi:hypothetical protein [Reyranella sp.]|uniref:hypothetical protein n=1 Tax=Reyranella sp. TaxID=1929291 RepID=UPI003D12AAC4
MPDGSKPPERPKLDELAAQLSESLNKAEPRPRRRRAKEADPPQEPPPPDPPDDDGGGDDDGENSYFRVPRGCPVIPLGIDGKEFLFIDANRQYVKVHHRDFGGQGLSALFGKFQLYLDSAWPRTNAKGTALGLDKDRAARSLMAACALKGVFDSDNKIRGVGAWTDAHGRLIWHLGDVVLVVDADGRHTMEPIGTVGDHVYPQGVPQVRPALLRRDARAAIDRFYTLLQSWHWKRGELDARLQLGWIGCALIGGALKWRPAVWATGGQGTGKSTLHDAVLNPVLGGTPSVVQTADATGPGLYQALQSRSTPVIFDELEPDPELRARIEATIKLAKISASGARIVRGTPDGTHKEFVARAAFLFSSILVPRLEPELAMRIGILDLRALGDRKEPKIAAADMLETGALLRALLVERWRYWPDRLERHRQALRTKGFEARIADTWGTLLAMADHLLSAEPSAEEAPADTFDVWADELKPWLDALVEQAGSDHARLLQTLLTTTVDPFAKGQRWPLSTLLSITASRSVSGEDPTSKDPEMTHERAASGLESLGMKYMLVTPPRPDDADEKAPPPAKIWAVAIASNHTELNKLLKDTKWGRGVYTQTLLRIPGAWSTQQRIARHKTQCAMIPIDLVLPPEGGSEGLFT